MATIEELVASIQYNQPQRSNRFQCKINLPAFLGGNSIYLAPGGKTNEAATITLPVVNFIMPQKDILVKEFSYYGADIKIPYKRKFGDLSITFLADEEGIFQLTIESWMDKLINPVTDTIQPFSQGSGGPARGTVEIQEISYGSQNPDAPKYIFYEAFPKSILPFTFDDESKNEILKFQVLFAFRQYEFISDSYKTNPTGAPSGAQGPIG